MEYYKKRIVDKILERKLQGKGAVLIEGPKWCGKTTTAEQVAKSVLYMSNPAGVSYNLLMADTNPSRLPEGDTPRLIDEWQIAPGLWDAARFEVDHRGEMGQFRRHFFLAGTDKRGKQTGFGRNCFSYLSGRMAKLFFFERGCRTGSGLRLL